MAMTIMGRSSSRILRAVLQLPSVFLSLSGALRFRNPGTIIASYLRRRCPRDLYVETRSGYKLRLSGDGDDLVTVLAVFGRKEYGQIPEQGVVIDVGAHLGSFALYAAMNRARKVYCYEPDPTLHGVLAHNIRSNNLDNSISSRQAAVVGKTTGRVAFYPEGNASGHVARREYDTDGVTVDAVTLAEIILDNNLQEVDLLKLDCEGSEYGIISETPTEIWSRIKKIRLEYHRDDADMLERRFRDLGYQIVRHLKRGKNVGILWVEMVPRD